MSRCWTCRRRRLKCDGAVPSCQKCLDNGVECLGYVKPLTWVDGVAARGPMKNRGFGKRQIQVEAPLVSEAGVSHSSQLLSTASTDLQTGCDDCFACSGTDSSRSSRQASAECSETSSSDILASFRDRISPPKTTTRYSPPPMVALTEPLFQDLDLASRFFIDYYSRRVCPIIVLRDYVDNKYREIIPLIASSPAIASAIMAIASCHFTHSMMGAPVLSLRSETSNSSASREEMSMILSNPADTHLSKSILISHYLRSKTNCLNNLAAALADATQNQGPSTLVAIVLLTILELYESGAGSWTIHLEGAKRLLVDGARNASRVWNESPLCLVDDVSLFQTFGSSLARPGLLSSSFSTHIAQAMCPDSPAVTLLGCPLNILSAVEFFASQRRLITEHTRYPFDLDGLNDSLLRIQAFNVGAWATAVSLDNIYDATVQDLQRLGIIWKLGAEIYACRILANITKDPHIRIPSIDDIVAEYAFPELEDDDLIKVLMWPTFIAGAACTKLEHRDWALRTLDRIWEVALCANAKNAAVVLTNLWKKQDLRNTQLSFEALPDVQAQKGEDWDWLSELSSLEDSWLFI